MAEATMFLTIMLLRFAPDLTRHSPLNQADRHQKIAREITYSRRERLLFIDHGGTVNWEKLFDAGGRRETAIPPVTESTKLQIRL
jgi:hypothetical protein